MCENEHDPRRVTGILGIVDALVTGMVNLQIYPREHPRVQNAVEDLVARLNAQRELDDGVFRLGVDEGYIVHDHRPVLGATLSAPRYVDAVGGLEIGGLQQVAAVDAPAVISVLQVLNDGGKQIRGHQDANAFLARNGGAGIRFMARAGGGSPGEAEPGAAAAAEDLQVERIARSPVEIYQQIVETLQEITVRTCRGDQFSMEAARACVESILQELSRDAKTMPNLARYEQYDAFTFGHSIRVAVLAASFARSWIDDPDLLLRIGVAALLHDVGKALVPFEILHSSKRLGDDERRVIERHTSHGAHLLLDVDEPDPMAVACAFGHHRTEDGGGYPAAVSDAGTSVGTKIVKICDVYEALTANRPYKAGMSPTRAYRIMMGMKGHFHLGLLRTFIECNGLFPIGYEVQLNNGERALVERQTGDLRRPVVRTTLSREGDPLHGEDRREIDLRATREAGLEVVELYDATNLRVLATQ